MLRPCFAELAGQVERAKQEQAEQMSKLLNPAQKENMENELNRVQSNIKRLQQV